jgi:hypothetical protein
MVFTGERCFFGLVPVDEGSTYGFAGLDGDRFDDPPAGRLERLRQRFERAGRVVPDDGAIVVGGDIHRLGVGARAGVPVIHPLVVQRAGRVVVPDVEGVHPAVREMHPGIRVDPEEEPEAERPGRGTAITFPLGAGRSHPVPAEPRDPRPEDPAPLPACPPVGGELGPRRPVRRRYHRDQLTAGVSGGRRRRPGRRGRGYGRQRGRDVGESGRGAPAGLSGPGAVAANEGRNGRAGVRRGPGHSAMRGGRRRRSGWPLADGAAADGRAAGPAQPAASKITAQAAPADHARRMRRE